MPVNHPRIRGITIIGIWNLPLRSCLIPGWNEIEPLIFILKKYTNRIIKYIENIYFLNRFFSITKPRFWCFVIPLPNRSPVHRFAPERLRVHLNLHGLKQVKLSCFQLAGCHTFASGFDRNHYSNLSFKVRFIGVPPPHLFNPAFIAV